MLFSAARLRGADSPRRGDGSEGGSGLPPAFNQVEQSEEDSPAAGWGLLRVKKGSASVSA